MVWVSMSHWSPRSSLRALNPGPFPKDWCYSLCLHTQTPLAAGRHKHVSCFSAGNCHSAWIPWYLFIYYYYFFSVYAALWDSKTPHWPTCDRVMYCVETSPSWLLPQDGSHSLNTLAFHLYFLSYLISKRLVWPSVYLGSSAAFRSCFVEVAPHSDDLYTYLWGESGLSVLFLFHLGISFIITF